MISTLLDRIENFIFGSRPLIVGLFLIITVIMGYGLTQLHIDAGFSKHLPLQHECMRTFMEYRKEFGGATRVVVALRVRDGTMFTAEFFNALRQATDEVFFISGVDRSQSVRYSHPMSALPRSWKTASPAATSCRRIFSRLRRDSNRSAKTSSSPGLSVGWSPMISRRRSSAPS